MFRRRPSQLMKLSIKTMKSVILVACLLALSVMNTSGMVNPNGVGWCQNQGQRCRHTGNMKCCNSLECKNQRCQRRGGRCQRLNDECNDFGSRRCCEGLRCRRRGMGSRQSCQMF